MSLLDRLRPKWQHSDPEVRMTAVRQLGRDDQDLLSNLAREDDDPRVRRIAVKKIEDPRELQAISEHERNESLKELAAGRAAELLVARASSKDSLDGCEEALSRLTQTKHIVQVAIHAAHPSIRRAALARLSDEKAVAEIAARASDPSLREEALGRVRDPSLLQRIAANGAAPEIALAAVEKIDDADTLHAIAEERHAHRSVREKAHARLELIMTDDHPLRAEPRRKRQQELCLDLESLAETPEEKTAEIAAERIREEWNRLAAKTDPDEDVRRRFEAAGRAVSDQAERQASRKAEEERREAQRRMILANRLALCEKVESLEGDAALPGLEQARADWESLDPLPADATTDEGEALAIRFARAAEQCQSRHQSWRTQLALERSVEELLAEAEAHCQSPRLSDAVRDWQLLQDRWTKIEETVLAGGWKELAANARQRFDVAGQRLVARQKENADRQEQVRQQNLARLRELCTRLEGMGQTPELSLKAAGAGLRRVAQVMKQMGSLPTGETRTAWKDRLTLARQKLFERFQEQKETEEWKRWANVDVQEKLIGKTEALGEVQDLGQVAKQLRQIQEEWKRAGEAPRGKSESLWKRFSKARDELRDRCHAYYAENLKRKEALCEKVESLAQSSDWNKTAEAIKKIQAEWKETGPVAPKKVKAVWHRFRKPCDEFFTRRKEHLDRLKDDRLENAKKKAALCEKAEWLADSTQWDEASKEIMRLQSEWKEIGPVPHKKSEVLWNRFRTACDRFFDRRKRRGEVELEEKLRTKEATCLGLEALAASVQGADAPSAETVGQRVLAAWTEWTSAGAVPPGKAEALQDRLQKACAQIVAVFPDSLRGTPLDPRANHKRREKICLRLEELVAAHSKSGNHATIEDVAEKLKRALAANTIGATAVPQKKNWRAALEEAEQLKANWERLGPILGAQDRILSDRFRKAYENLSRLRRGSETDAPPTKLSGFPLRDNRS